MVVSPRRGMNTLPLQDLSIQSNGSLAGASRFNHAQVWMVEAASPFLARFVLHLVAHRPMVLAPIRFDVGVCVRGALINGERG